jgi:hypothetical protein
MPRLPDVLAARAGQLALGGDTAAQLQKARTGYGPLLESFLASEVLKIATWSESCTRCRCPCCGRRVGVSEDVHAEHRPQSRPHPSRFR